MVQVLEEHQLSCMDLLHVNTDGVILTKQSKKLQSMKLFPLFSYMHMHALSSSIIVFVPSIIHFIYFPFFGLT